MKLRILFIPIFLLAFYGVSAQSISKVYGEYCVNSTTVFQQMGSCSGFSWGVSSGVNGVDYTIIGSTTQSSFQVKWLRSITTSVRCTSTCSGSFATRYSSSFTIGNSTTPSVSLSLNSTQVCEGSGSIVFTATPTNGGTSPYYYWYVDGSQVASGSSSSYTYSTSSLAAGSHSAYVTLSSNAPCQTTTTATSSTQNFTVTARVSYSVDVSGPSTICSGSSSASFYANVLGGSGNMSYQWYKNGSLVSGATSYYFSTPVSQGNTIYCQVSSDYWCINSPVNSNTYTVNITSSATPTVGINVNKITFCSGETISFTASSSYINGSSTYQWKLNGNLFSTANSASLPVTTDGGAPNSFSPGDVVTVDVGGLSGTCLTSTTATGTTSGTPFTINPMVTPAVSLTVSPTSLCLPGTITLTANPTNSGSSPSYAFYIDGAQVASGSSNTYSSSSIGAGSHSAYVVMTSNAQCLTASTGTSATQNFTVASKANYTVTNNGPGQICSHNPNATFVAMVSNGVGTLSYQWYKNGSPVSGATSSSYSTSVTQGNTIYCSVSSNYWCVNTPVPSNTYTVNLTTSTTPTIGVQVPKLNWCTGETISFTASSSYITGSSTYSWKLNGSQFSTASSASLPVSTDVNAANTFSPGDVVTVDVGNLSGTCLSSTSATGTTSGTPFTINPMVTPSISLTTANVCLPGNVTLTASPANGGSSPTYTFYIDGSQVASGTSNTYSASIAAGAHSAYVIMASNAPCLTAPTATSATQNFTVASKATYTVTNNGPSQICSHNPNATFVAMVSGGVGTLSYQWYKNGSSVSGATSSSYSTSVTQGNTIYCVVTSNYWCVNSPVTSNTYTVNITSSTTPTIGIQVPKLNYCSGETITFTASSPYISGSSTYSWKLNGNQFSTASSTSLPVTTDVNLPNAFNPGDVVTVDVTALTGTCLTSTTATGTTSGTPISIYALPDATLTPTGSTKICSTCTQPLTVPSVSGNTYQWKKGGVSIPAPEGTANPYIASAAGTYTAVVTTVNGCVSNSPNSLVLTINIAPVANAGPDQTIVLPQNFIALNGSGSDADGTITGYTWRQISGPSTTLAGIATANLSVTVSGAGVYTFGLKVSDELEQSSEDEVILTVNYPPNNYNKIIENNIYVKDQLYEDDIELLSIQSGQMSTSITYFDGLGKPMQSVSVQASPLAKDVANPILYDDYGRNYRNYLRVTVPETNGFYKKNADIIDANTGNYKGVAANFYSDSRPFTETEFERSPLSKTVKEFGAGNDWKINDKFIGHQYLTNTHGTGSSLTAEKIVAWKISADMPARATAVTGYIETNGYYSTGQLIVKSTKDEHGNEVREYVDKAGRVILKKVQAVTPLTSLNNNTEWALTYYIYDDFGNLRFVFQPLLSAKVLGSDTYVPTPNDLNTLSFQYKYDNRQRLIEKKVPGAERVIMVYDNFDRLVMTQDGNQFKDADGGNSTRQWMFTKYDALNRPVITGIYTHSVFLTQAGMAALIITGNESYNQDVNNHGYTNAVFPTTNIKVLTITYYDNYNFRDDLAGATDYSYTLGDITGQEPVENTDVTGMLTGTKINILESNNYLWNVSYYDNKYRIIQTKTQNHKGGIDRVTNLYDFVKVKETKTIHNKGASSYSQHLKYEYDHAGRVSKVQHKFHTEPNFVILQKNTYNEAGQLITKKLHSRDNGNNYAQSIDYTYTIRGWLDKVNDPVNPEPGDLYSMEMKYHQPSAKGGPAQYNGNISEIVWKSAGLDKQSYGYKYDGMNRILEARYYNLARPLNDGRYTELIDVEDPLRLETYDLNGNIKNLSRYGKVSATSYGKIDDLVYTYKGGGNNDNLLARVDDFQQDTNFDDGFKDLVKISTEYTYDWNGNMNLDRNKGITSITYNLLNQPKKVSKSTTEYIIYTYDATGKKLSQQVFGSAPKTTDYIGEYVYENDFLQFVSHLEGRIVPDISPAAPRPWDYQYFLKDHLGNVRVIFSEKKATFEYKATLEANTQENEQVMFRKYNNLGGLNEYDHTDIGNVYTKSHHLNGGSNYQVGLSKSFEVNSGDVIDLEVYAKYEAPPENPLGNDVSSLLSGLISAFSLGAGTSPLDGSQAQTAFNNLFPGGGPWITSSKWEDDVAPKAYLNYILFDENFVLVDFGFDQISVNAKQVGLSPVVPHDLLNLHVKVQQKGYLYVYLSNENPVQSNVYFDDFKITYNTGVEQVSDYYAFGLKQNSNGFDRQGTTKNSYLYNGKELQDELNLGWLDYGARMYDPAIGRWNAIDPLSEKYYGVSPFSYVVNNPIILIDPDGRAWRPTFDPNTGRQTGYEWVPDEESYEEDGALKKGLYHQAIFFTENGTFDPENDFNMGSSTAYVYKADGTTETFDANTYPSDLDDYPTTPEGIYEAKVGTHTGSSGNSYTALRMGDVGTTDFSANKIELGKKNPAHPNRTYAQGVNIHKAGQENKTGMTLSGSPISAACTLMDINNWSNFIGIFNTDAQKDNTISVTMSRSYAKPTNINVPLVIMPNLAPNDATRVVLIRRAFTN